MKPCKAAYKTVRKNDNEIYKGFGFRHLSDATSYYVHSNNESYSGTTTLCQTIGEAVILAAEYISGILNDKNAAGEVFYSDKNDCFWIDIPVPDDYRQHGVTPAFGYRAYSDKTSVIKICAVDRYGMYIDSNPSNMDEYNKLFAVLLILLMRFICEDDEYAAQFLKFAENPGAADFVKVHEDFYQHYKNTDYIISYRELLSVPAECPNSLRDKLKTMLENAKQNEEEDISVPIKPFPDGTFTEYTELIPHLSAEFVLPAKLNSICSAVSSGDMRAVLLHGPAGTGKTMSCKLICQNIGLPIMDTVNCSENLDEFILGKFLPEGDMIVFKESYVTKAIRYGGAVIFEEINFSRPQYLSFLNSLLDDNGFVRLDNGEVVRRHENFRFFATMNIGYYGTKELNQALYNRFNAIIEIEELSDDAISKMLLARVPECEEQIKNIIGVYHRIKDKISAEELDMVISPRNLENWARMARYEGYVKAAEKTIIPIARNDRTSEDAFRKMIASYKWQVKAGAPDTTDL